MRIGRDGIRRWLGWLGAPTLGGLKTALVVSTGWTLSKGGVLLREIALLRYKYCTGSKAVTSQWDQRVQHFVCVVCEVS